MGRMAAVALVALLTLGLVSCGGTSHHPKMLGTAAFVARAEAVCTRFSAESARAMQRLKTSKGSIAQKVQQLTQDSLALRAKSIAEFDAIMPSDRGLQPKYARYKALEAERLALGKKLLSRPPGPRTEPLARKTSNVTHQAIRLATALHIQSCPR
jgi:hypothetical protein